MKARYFNFASFLLLVTLLAFSACKKEFDEPPIADLPNMKGNTSIASIVAMAQVSPVALDTQILEATVIADDKSGNFYKQLVIQDSTGGIRIDIDAYSIYTDFPIGRKVWIKCQGLYVWQDGDVAALIGSFNTADSRIPQSTYKHFIIGGEYNQPLTPKLRSLLTLGPADYHSLIQMDSVEFVDCATYADPVTQTSENRELISCKDFNIPIVVRNSGFASFAGEYMPTGNGSIVAVYNSFGGTAQLFIRDPSDVSSMTDTNRCTAIIPCVSGPILPMSIQAVRDLYTGTNATAPPNTKIVGIVISDLLGGNWQDQNIILQEVGGAGIAVRFDAQHNFNRGDEVEIDISGEGIQEFNGLLQVYATLANSTALSFGNSITPRVATVSAIIANGDAWESTLINVQSASLVGGPTYGANFDNVDLTDATGSIKMFSTFSNFESILIPTGTGDVVGVVGDYNGIQINIRDTADVNIFGGGGGGGGGPLNQITIQDARNLFTGSATTAPNTTKIVGIVISNIPGGNWVDQNMVIQEQGGAGITVRFDAPHSFNQGDEVEVDISNQTISEFNGLLQVDFIPLSKATVLSTGNNITPRVATVADITANANAWESTLINVVNANLNGGTTYGDFGIMLNDATGSISMFSAFSNFASTAIPTGTGDVTGVVGDYNGTQINIRNTSDVNIGGGGGGVTTTMPIASVRSLFPGSVPANTDIAGIVISDRVEGNITAKNIVVQNSNGSGIVVRFTADNSTINIGDSVNIDVSGIGLTEYNGLMQIENVPNANVTVLSSGNSITPRVATTADIATNAEAWESTLVQITASTITGTTYSGTTTVTDASGTIDLYTRPSANFSSNNVATGTVNITAIVSQFTTTQINIRTLSDVQ